MMFTSIRIALPVLLLTAATAFAAEPAATKPPAAAPAPSATSTDASPAVDTSAPQPAAANTKPAASGKRAQNDRLDLDTTIVTGNRELPKVLYIVPWKKADLGDLPAQPFNTLLDEVLAPVDRDVFRREVTYYGVVSSGGNASPAAAASPGGDPAAPARGDEK
jgi:cytoskeletal protein RodZ